MIGLQKQSEHIPSLRELSPLQRIQLAEELVGKPNVLDTLLRTKKLQNYVDAMTLARLGPHRITELEYHILKDRLRPRKRSAAKKSLLGAALGGAAGYGLTRSKEGTIAAALLGGAAGLAKGVKDYRRKKRLHNRLRHEFERPLLGSYQLFGI